MYRIIITDKSGVDDLGCIDSIEKTMAELGAECFFSLDPEDVASCDGIILPGAPPDVDPALYEKEKEPDKNSLNKLSNNESGLLSSSIKKLQTGDDMDIMNELILLCEQLSLSSDQIGDNPNMPKLLEEVSKNYEKLYLPEIIIYSLQCTNYILDINPGLTSVLKRINAIPKIIALITAMEDTSCLELIVSVFEKISFENSFLLLENNVFISLLNVIDFLAFAQQKSIMKTCQNISANALTFKQFDLYIKPALEQLCSLTKFN